MPTDSRRAVLRLIAVTLALRLLWAATLEPSNDEAYHWLYTVHPALSYFDHPPMTAWVEWLGITACGGWVHPLSLRLGFVLLFAGSTWILYRWAERWYGGWAGYYAAVGLNLSAYFTAAGGAFALPDGPFLFFALLTFWQASEALLGSGLASRGCEPTGSETGQKNPWVHTHGSPMKHWLLVGVGFGGAMLSKYHGVFLPAGVVAYVLVTAGMRRVLLTPGPYLAVAMGVVGFLPVLLWNSANGWASFRFQGGRAVGMAFKPVGVMEWTVGPVLYLLPGIWFALVREAVPRMRHFRSTVGIDRLLVCLSVVPLFFFLLVSCTREVLLHWNLIGFIPLYLLAGKRWAEWTKANPARARFGLRVMTVSLLALVAFAWLHIQFGLIRIPGKDPTDDIAGWVSVMEGLEARGLLDDPEMFLASNRWYDAGQLAFATRNRRPVACYNSLDARGFAFWSRPEDWVGRSGYFVLANNYDDDRAADSPDEPEEAVQVRKELAEFFQSVTLAARFPMTRGGRPWRDVRVYKCYTQTRPYPFTYEARK